MMYETVNAIISVDEDKTHAHLKKYNEHEVSCTTDFERHVFSPFASSSGYGSGKYAVTERDALSPLLSSPSPDTISSNRTHIFDPPAWMDPIKPPSQLIVLGGIVGKRKKLYFLAKVSNPFQSVA